MRREANVDGGQVMTDVQIKEALSRVIADVLERFAFSFAEEEDGVVEEDGECLCADLAFRGPVRGTVSLAVPLRPIRSSALISTPSSVMTMSPVAARKASIFQKEFGMKTRKS